mmetsp:Transcript_1530/g.2500  ORF Transcript_1530/g.2500 Transcript_1530/m.2500 type:complete len:94 (+) Transcript_1530:142-423(+)
MCFDVEWGHLKLCDFMEKRSLSHNGVAANRTAHDQETKMLQTHSSVKSFDDASAPTNGRVLDEVYLNVFNHPCANCPAIAHTPCAFGRGNSAV